jgi:hypothetical protein
VFTLVTTQLGTAASLAALSSAYGMTRGTEIRFPVEPGSRPLKNPATFLSFEDNSILTSFRSKAIKFSSKLATGKVGDFLHEEQRGLLVYGNDSNFI